MEFTLKNGSTMQYDAALWTFSRDRTMETVGESDMDLRLRSRDGFECSIAKELLAINEISWEGQELTLPQGLFEKYVFQPMIEEDKVKFNELFLEHAALVFSNPSLVLSNPVYFLLRPPYLYTASMLTSEAHFCLGALMEAWESDEDFYFEDFYGDRGVYLMMAGGSILSGASASKFWSPSEQKVIHNSIQEGKSFPKTLAYHVAKLTELKKLYAHLQLEKQHAALQLLLKELS